MYTILVCGGRKFADYPLLVRTLNQLKERCPDEVCRVIHGGATGADGLASRWSDDFNNENYRVFPALWDDIEAEGAVIHTRRDGTAYNVLAGFWRNQTMLEKGCPDVVVAFPGGRGTVDMVKKSRVRGYVRDPVESEVVYLWRNEDVRLQRSPFLPQLT